MKNVIAILFCALFVSLNAFSHEGHHHGHHPDESKSKGSITEEKAMVLKRINESYLINVKPIFQKSCFDCHSNQTRFPWYYKIPGIKQWIDSDIAESKEHLDFTNDFPFKGHGSIEDDLHAISDVIKDGSMPPLLYRMVHKDSKMNAESRETVLKWLSEANTALAPH